MTDATADSTEYERGHVAGEISARLATHDLHFAAINGSIADVARGMHDVGEQTRRLADSMAFDKQANAERRAERVEAERLAAAKVNNKIITFGVYVSVLVVVVNVLVALVVHHVIG